MSAADTSRWVQADIETAVKVIRDAVATA
jgi:hypothetical protein